MTQSSNESQVYDSKCKAVLMEKGVRFAAIINHDSKIISGGFGPGIKPLEGDEQRLNKFIEFAVNVTLRGEYDASLGALNYIASRRDKVILISFPFPVSRNILLVSAEPGIDIENLATKIVPIFAESTLKSDRSFHEVI